MSVIRLGCHKGLGISKGRGDSLALVGSKLSLRTAQRDNFFKARVAQQKAAFRTTLNRNLLTDFAGNQFSRGFGLIHENAVEPI